MGQAPPGSSYNDRGEGWPLVAGAGDFKLGAVTVKKFTTAPAKLCGAGDILLSIRASIGDRVWADRELALGRGVAGLRPGGRLDAGYLWHWLDHVRPRLAAQGRGATFLQVNRTDVNDLTLELPSLKEQRRIAAILDKAAAAQKIERRAKSQLDALHRANFTACFGDPSEWPARWPMATIGDLAESVQYGSSSKSGSAGEWPILRMGNVSYEGWLDLADLKYIDLSPRDVVKYTVRRGDMLFNRTNSAEKVGKSCVVETDQPLAPATSSASECSRSTEASSWLVT